MALTRSTLVLTLLAVSLAAHAQETAPAPESPSAAAPAHAATPAATVQPGEVVFVSPVRTARLARITGDVQVQRTDNTGETAAVLNMPLPAGTRISTGDYAQAEIEFDDGSVARLTPQTVLSLDVLASDASAGARSELSVLGGLVYFELRATHENDWQVQAGNAAASPTSNSVLRIALDQPSATFAVVSGSAQIVSLALDQDSKAPGFATTVRTGESLRADPDDPTRYFLNQQIEPQPWDQWNLSRDEHAAEAADTRTSARDAYAANQAYGWSDLDNNGTWYAAPAPEVSDGADTAAPQDTTAPIWQPAAAADPDSEFDPYADGALVWSGGNYVWASAYPWGWTPYRCGRWNYYPGLGWAWQPNRACLTIGYGGYAGILIGPRRPLHYRPVGIPLPTPGPVHPILRVGSGGTQPARPHSGSGGALKVAKIDGNVLTPLHALGPVRGAGLVAGSALYRDFPVEPGTRKPVVGLIARSASESTVPAVSGWIARQSEPVSPAPPRTVRAPSGMTQLLPVTRAQSPSHEASTLRVERSAPAPAPAPPPRSAPAPAAAPAAASSSPAKPK